MKRHGAVRALCALACALAAACDPPRARLRQGRADPQTCVLIDSDATFDDFRAIAALVGNRRVVGVVTTSGLASAAGGAGALRHLLRSSSVPVTVGEGRDRSDDPRDDWIARDRVIAESLNGVLPAGSVGPARFVVPEAAVARWTRGCRHVDVLVLGPWSSFVRYLPALGDSLGEVYSLGPDPAEMPSGARLPFNCRYDLAACRRAPETVLWVALPLDPPEAYRPTAEMFAALPSTGVSGALREVFAREPEHWNRFSLWDDAVVLRYLHPQDFSYVGRHDEPNVTPTAFRARWVEATRAAR